MRLPVGTQVGEYEIQRFLGQGTFGTVYQAVHPVIGKRGAVKVLRYDALDDADTVQRFKGEAQAVNAIEHPNIVDIFSFGHLDDGRPYLIMEYLDGCSLEDLLDQHGGQLPAETVLPILHEVALAVDAAHEAGVIHRDLKPDNIFISRTGSGVQVVKVLDFGVAKLMFQGVTATAPGMPMGTPLYMAPEQCLDEYEVDYRIDVYAFGVTAFNCLTGEFPVDSDTYAGIVRHHITGQRTLLSELDPALAHFDQALQRCLTVEAEERFQSLRDAYEALATVHYGVQPGPAAARVPTHDPAQQALDRSGIVQPEIPASKSSKQATLPGPLAAQRARERAASAPIPQPLHPSMHPPPRAPTGPAPMPSAPEPEPTPLPAPTGLVPGPRPPAPAAPSGGADALNRTLDSSSAELLTQQYKLRRPYVRPLLLVAVAAALITGIALLWPTFNSSDGDTSASQSDFLEEAVAALGAKRWDEASTAAERVLQSDPNHAQAKHIVEQARQEGDNQEHFRALMAAIDVQDMRTAKTALTAIPAFSVYAAEAQRSFDAATDRWFEIQKDIIKEQVSGRKPSRKDCATARRLVRAVGEVRASDRKAAARIYRKSKCRQKIGSGSKSGKASDDPDALVAQALAAAKNKNYGRAYTLCQRALDGSSPTSKAKDLATCTTVACNAREPGTARTWYRRVPKSSVHRKNARRSCQRSGVKL